MRKILTVALFFAAVSFQSLAQGNGLERLDTARASLPQTLRDREAPLPDHDLLDYSRAINASHPRLFATEKDFSMIRKKVATVSGRRKNPVLASIHDVVMENADSFLIHPIPVLYKFDASNKRLLPMAKHAFNQIIHWSYAYKVTGGEEYLEAARGMLSTVCNFPNWNAKHYLDVAEFCLAVSVAYDWLYDRLTKEERDLARECLVRNAMLQPRHFGFSWEGTQSSTSNWNQVCCCGLVCACIAIIDEEPALCKELIQRLLPTNVKAQKHIYSPDGAYPEGYMYWTYGTEYETMLLTALQTAFGSTSGLDGVEGFDRTGRYILYMTGMDFKCYAYSDCVSGWNGKIGSWYFASRYDDPSLLFNEGYVLKKTRYPGAGNDNSRYLPMAVIMGRDLNLRSPEIPKPKKNLYYGDGKTPVVLIHTGWNYDEGDHYLGFKGGSADFSHSQMDAGSFVYDAYGKRWSDDLGREAYTHIETPVLKAGGNFWAYEAESMRWQIFRYSNVGHSTLTVNGANFIPEGRADIVEVYEDDPNNLGGKVDLSAPLAGEVSSAVRTIRLVNEEDLHVTDEIEALPDKDARVQWRMITPASVKPGVEYEVLTSGDVSMLLQASVSDPSVRVTYTSWPATRPEEWVPRTWDTPNKGYSVAGFTFIVPAGHKVKVEATLSRLSGTL